MKYHLLLVVLAMIFIAPHALDAQSENPLFHEKVHFGRGAILNAQWHPSGQSILVETVTGVWVYRAFRQENVTHIEDARLGKFSPDGMLLAGIDRHNHLLLWEVPGYSIIADPGGRDAHVISLEWNPNGTEIATLDYTGTITIWDVPHRKIHVQFQMEEANQIAWSRGGSYLAAIASVTGNLKVWDHDGLQVLETRPHYIDTSGGDILWRSDTQLVRRTYGDSADGERWDVRTGANLGHMRIGYSSAYSPDGSKIANGYLGLGSINDADTNEVFAKVDISEAIAVSWSPDGSKVAFGDWIPQPRGAAQLIVANALTGETLYQATFSSSITQAVWCGDNNGLLVVDELSQLQIVSTNSSTGCLSGGSNAHLEIGNVAAWSSDSQMIIASDNEYSSRLWDAQTGALLRARMNIGQPITQVAWQPRGTLVATTSSIDRYSLNNNVYIWDTGSAPSVDSDPIMIIPHTSAVAGMTWSPDGNTLATAESTRYLRLWSPAKAGIISVIDLWRIFTKVYPIFDVGWNTSGDIVSFSYYSSGEMASVGLVDATSGKIIKGGGTEYSVWTQDNRLISASWRRYRSPDHDIHLDVGYDNDKSIDYSTTTLSVLPHNQLISKTVFSPNAALLFAAYQNKSAIIWDLQTYKSLAEMTNVSGQAIWSPDSTMLAVWGSDGLLRVIEYTTGKILQVLDQHYTTYPNSVTAPQVIWSPDAQQLAVLDRGTVFIYTMEG